ncbi:alpha/beta hydrolase fold domain-containing protein [Geodermatophilus africanus]|uniref:alpha/beta hydrolase n=1 Tax=Geodermatophilus africanus TaxID=1137993 RepID=UPI000B808940
MVNRCSQTPAAGTRIARPDKPGQPPPVSLTSPTPRDARNPSPRRRSWTTKLAALPPLLVVSAERDSLRPQIERFVAKARAKGVQLTYHCASGVDHDFPSGRRARARPH